MGCRCSLSQNVASYRCTPTDSRESLSLPAKWATAQAGPPGGKGRRRARGGVEGGRRARPDPVPVRFMHPTFGPPIDRPHHGPRLKMHERRERPGGRREFAMATRPQLRPSTSECCVLFHVFVFAQPRKERWVHVGAFLTVQAEKLAQRPMCYRDQSKFAPRRSSSNSNGNC